LKAAFSPPASVRAAEAVAAVRVLIREIGLPATLGTLAGFLADLGPLSVGLRQRARPATTEVAVVEQAIVSAIALYRRLRPRLGQSRALEVMHAIVVPSGERLMERAFPPLPAGDALAGLASFMQDALGFARRHGLYDFELVEESERRVRLDMTYCRYAELCALAGVPELASRFCAVDRPFFDGLTDEIDFSCAERLADGAPACTFCFERA